MKPLIHSLLFQKILRINSHVSWPVNPSSSVGSPEKIKLSLSDNPWLGFMPGSYIQAINGIEVGCNLWAGPGVKIISANHDLDCYDLHELCPPVKIGDNCWLAANCVLLPGVKLGVHTVVAAGAVVTRSFPEGNCVLAGVPAKKVKTLGEYKGFVKSTKIN